MKLKLIITFVTVLVLLPFLVIAAFNWNTETADATPGAGWDTSIAINSTDDVHISYYDSANGALKHAWYGLDALGVGAWHTETVDSAPGENIGQYTSIAINSTDDVHISYCDETNNGLKHAWYDNTAGTWHTETVDSAPGENIGWYTSIAINSTEDVHISYTAAFPLYDLKHAWYDNTAGTWHTETVDSEDNVGWYTSIAINSTEDVHISYADAINGDPKLKHAWYDNTAGTWHTETVDNDNDLGDLGWYTSTVIDSLDHIHVSYYASNIGLKHAWYDGAWHTETIDSEGDVGRYTSIAIDSADIVHISYWDADNNYLKHAYGDGVGGAWILETVDDAGAVGSFTSITINSTDVVHISYLDIDNVNLKHAYGEVIPPVIPTIQPVAESSDGHGDNGVSAAAVQELQQAENTVTVISGEMVSLDSSQTATFQTYSISVRGVYANSADLQIGSDYFTINVGETQIIGYFEITLISVDPVTGKVSFIIKNKPASIEAGNKSLKIIIPIVITTTIVGAAVAIYLWKK